MWRLGDEDALAQAWRAARPFPHVVIDDFCTDLDAVMVGVEEENVDPYGSDLFAFEATAPEPKSAEMRALRAGFAELAAPLARITGIAISRADMRAYAYRPGHYLLPHTDHQDGLERRIAYAYYLPTPHPPEGGELELFAGYDSAVVIAPVPNRIALFEVGDGSLHQVREVLAGLRLSLAGWFYA